MRQIYLDNGAATKIHPKALEAMIPYFTEHFGNPLSRHGFGSKPASAVENARKQVAELIGANPVEVYFTSCGSESNNAAIKGVSSAKSNKGKHIIISSIEHPSVLLPCETLKKTGFEITYIPVDKYGIINPEDVKKAVKKETILVSMIHSHLEIGTIEPIEEIGKITKENGITFNVDAVATAGLIPINVNSMNADLLSLSSEQYYGPKGIAGLFIRKGTSFNPLIEGGMQENRKRAGNHNVPAIAGMGAAAQLAKEEMQNRTDSFKQLRNKLIKRIPENIKNVHFTGHPENRLPHHASFCFEYIEGESIVLLLRAKGIAASSGSTCSSPLLKASHVLKAVGLTDMVIQGSIQFVIGPDITDEDMDYTVNSLVEIVEKLRKMSPLVK